MNNDIRIIGIDQQRPARVRKEAYIDLVFKLSQKAPTAWIDLFDTLGRQIEPSVKVDTTAADCVIAWVRHMEDIPDHFDEIKQGVLDCNTQYQEKLSQQALAASNQATIGADNEQARLDAIVAGLDFE